MRKPHHKHFFWWSVLLFCVFSVSDTLSEPVQKEIESPQKKPIEISSDSLEVDNSQRVVTFYGNVQAKMEDFDVECNKMLVYYEESPSKQEAKKDDKPKVDKIIATGAVVIRRPEGGSATAEKAIYFQQDGKLILTGRPVVKQGDDFVEGDQITVFLTENRVIVESSENRRVKARIFSHEDNR